jgi:hypothetical protein
MVSLPPQSEERLLQLKVTLEGSKPPIWRRLVVRDSMKLPKFHLVLQLVMGWTNSHLHRFRVGKTYYGVPPDPLFAWSEVEELNEKKFRLSDLISDPDDALSYEYDFGDFWTHDVRVEKTLPVPADFKQPLCLGGAMACPLEDSGGLYGYYEKLEILGNPADPDHDEIADWVGSQFDPTYFNVEAVNRALKKLKV